MASVYEPLAEWLQRHGGATITLDFGQIETILGRRLPPSAHRYDRWWSNEDDPASTHSQSRRGWMAGGYAVSSVDRNFSSVTFVRNTE
ncbi:DUF7662 domain-containing protein [Asanoa iriomotensis]|nr:hypothetical protein [Asanoa iriomotensis]